MPRLSKLLSSLATRWYSRGKTARPQRRFFLEQLEARYALAVTAMDDSLTMAVNAPTRTIPVLANDTNTLISTLSVQILNGPAHGSVVVNPDQTISYTVQTTPELYTGPDSFSYRATDGVFFDDATVSIIINPFADADPDESYAIYEGGEEFFIGGNLVLDGSDSQGPELTYRWDIAPNPGVDPRNGGYAADFSDALVAADPTSPFLSVTWDDLVARGITDGLDVNAEIEDRPIITLEVRDANNNVAIAYQFLEIIDVDPFPTLAANAASCDGFTVALSGTFFEPNPGETNFDLMIDWGDETSTLAGEVTYAVGVGGTFTISPITHVYEDAGVYFPILTIVGHGEFGFGLVGDPEDPEFTGTITVPLAGGSGGADSVTIDNAPATSPEGSLISLDSTFAAGCGAGTPTYAWSVTKDGNPFAPGTPTDQETFSFTPNDNGAYVVSLAVNGVGGASDSKSITVTNVAPSIESLYASHQLNGIVLLVGSLTDAGSADSFVVHIVWETGETTDIPLAAGESDFSESYQFATTGSKPISVTVTDDDLSSDTDSATVFVPVALEDGGNVDLVGTPGSDLMAVTHGSVVVTMNGVPIANFPDAVVTSMTVNGGAGDDTITVEKTTGSGIVIDGGDGSDEFVIVAGETLAAPISISDAGTTGDDSITIQGTAGDDSITQSSAGFEINGASISVGAGLESAAIDGNGGNDEVVATGPPPVPVEVETVTDMVVVGTSGADIIAFSPGATAGEVVATLNNSEVSRFSPAGALIARGGDGNDEIQVAAGIALTARLYGGAGNDKLKGGSGPDILMGEDGDDLLVGAAGRDMLVGGDGKDALHGKAEDDILISGIVDFGANLDAAMAAIQAEWISGNNFIERTANIEGWGCNPTAYHLNGATVADDNDQDALTGDQGLDWFFANLWLDNGDDATKKDKIMDINLFEFLFANDLDF